MPKLVVYLRSIIQQFSSQFEVVDAVISGEAALKHLQSETIDLLITDISMHGMSGIELAHIAKKIATGHPYCHHQRIRGI